MATRIWQITSLLFARKKQPNSAAKQMQEQVAEFICNHAIGKDFHLVHINEERNEAGTFESYTLRYEKALTQLKHGFEISLQQSTRVGESDKLIASAIRYYFNYAASCINTTLLNRLENEAQFWIGELRYSAGFFSLPFSCFIEHIPAIDKPHFYPIKGLCNLASIQDLKPMLTYYGAVLDYFKDFSCTQDIIHLLFNSTQHIDTSLQQHLQGFADQKTHFGIQHALWDLLRFAYLTKVDQSHIDKLILFNETYQCDINHYFSQQAVQNHLLELQALVYDIQQQYNP